MDNDNVALCTYLLLSTIFLGLFATILTIYLFWLGRHFLHLVINCKREWVGICTLVYLPIADSLALRSLQNDMESRRTSELYNDTISLISNQSPPQGTSPSGKRGRWKSSSFA